MRTVDWTRYAYQYDLMAAVNPAYQEMLDHCRGFMKQWRLKSGDIVADIGGGTGNYSLRIAADYPDIIVLHIDNNDAMMRLAHKKAQDLGLENWQAVKHDYNSSLSNLSGLAGIISVNAIYPASNPLALIRLLSSAIRPEGYIYASDPGRLLRVSDWTKYLIGHSLKSNGILHTVSLLAQTGEVRKQNRAIATLQANGTFWTHTLEEFQKAFMSEGLEILFSADHLYRGMNNVVVARKQW